MFLLNIHLFIDYILYISVLQMYTSWFSGIMHRNNLVSNLELNLFRGFLEVLETVSGT